MAKRNLRTRAGDAGVAALDAVGKAAGRTKAKVADAKPELRGPSPNPRTNLLISDLALRSGSMIAQRAVQRVMLGARYTPEKAKAIVKGRSFTETMVNTALARVATRSLPGALLVGGAMVAKTLYDRGMARRAVADGEEDMQDLAEKGRRKK